MSARRFNHFGASARLPDPRPGFGYGFDLEPPVLVETLELELIRTSVEMTALGFSPEDVDDERARVVRAHLTAAR